MDELPATVTLLAVVFVLVSATFILVACGGKKNDEEDNEGTHDPNYQTLAGVGGGQEGWRSWRRWCRSRSTQTWSWRSCRKKPKCHLGVVMKFAGGNLRQLPLLLPSHSNGTVVPLELRRTKTKSIRAVHLSRNLVDYHQFLLTERSDCDLSQCELLSFKCIRSNCRSVIELSSTGEAKYKKAHSFWRNCLVPGVDLKGHIICFSAQDPQLKDETVGSYLIGEPDPKVQKMDDENLKKIINLPVYGWLGQGGFGTVLKTFSDPSCFAIKVANKKTTNIVHSFESEVLHLRCGNLLRGWSCETQNYELFIMEVGTPLHKLLPLDKKRLGCTAVQALNGIEFLHQKGFVHRDIKTNNILCYKSGRVVIGDFGVVCPILDITRSTEAAGNCLFQSPEAIKGEQIAPQSVAPCRDYWGLIVSLYHCLFTKLPFDMRPNSKRAYLVQQLQDQQYMENLDIATLPISHDESKEFKRFFYAYFVENWLARFSNEQLRAEFYSWSGFEARTKTLDERKPEDMQWLLASI